MDDIQLYRVFMSWSLKCKLLIKGVGFRRLCSGADLRQVAQHVGRKLSRGE